MDDVTEQAEVLRRVCERGINYGVDNGLTYVVDLFQHALDELERLVKYYEETC